MARFSLFSLKNFRGAKELTIALPHREDGAVVSLIGLNESGKTTILEGISRFGIENKTVSSVFDRVYTRENASSFIPIESKAAFDGNVEISAEVMIDELDIDAVESAVVSNGFQINRMSLPRKFWIKKEIRFENSVLKSTNNYWHLYFDAMPSKGGKYATYSGPKDGLISGDIWHSAVNEIEKRIPTIAYFPTFLVDIPDCVYLKQHAGESALNRYYREVIQDILQCLTPKMSLEHSILTRIDEFRAKEKTPFWISAFFGTSSKSNIDAVFQKLSSAITKQVLGSWAKVFNRPSGAKNIVLDWNIDAQKDDIPYLTFSVSDGESRYKISERSLGFRWFFSFLLFTAFKQAAPKNILFLFDEPAANLHAKAQAELLQNFGKIASGGNQIIYSTHSHHMIDPRWLSNAYIVDNTSIDYEKANQFELDSKPTDIIATNYRSFVSQYPNRTTYFQPVLERLEYVTPQIVGNPPFLIVEGITDYFALRYAKEFGAKKYKRISIMPGTGAGASGPLISYLMGKGDRFLVLMDDDIAGRKAAERYKTNWLLAENDVCTVGELVLTLQGKKLEQILSAETKDSIREKAGLAEKPNKKQIGWFLAEICATSEPDFALSEDTKNSLWQILDAAQARMERVVE